MSRARDFLLAATLLFQSLLFGWLANAEVLVSWLLGGGAAALGAEALAYRRTTAVRSAFERPVVSAVVAAGAGVVIGACAIVAPDRSLSVAVGALGTYLLLLVGVEATGWGPANPTKSDRPDDPDGE